MSRFTGLLLCIALALCACAVPRDKVPSSVQEDGTVTVRTSSGLVRGKVPGDGAVAVFQGIPYAAPPLGELRWKAPRPAVPWTGVRDAFEPGSPCPQSGRLAGSNEDCLNLNVWAPHRRATEKLPVMVFIHGGGQRESAANEYKADWLVTRGTPVIYVGINYRLNIFAFFAHKALTAEDPQLGSGNYAALDQMQALRWVRDNIASFGGDPGNVTIFGESGRLRVACIPCGAWPVPSRDLAKRALPVAILPVPHGIRAKRRRDCGAAWMPRARSHAVPAGLASTGGAGRRRGSSSVLDTSAAQPAWGGGVLPLPIREAMASGRFARVPFMQGSNRDEGMYHLTPRYDGGGKPVTAEQYPAILAQFLGPSRVAAVQEQYPLASHASPLQALAAALTDSGAVSNNRVGLCNLHLANQLASPHVALYSYEFADRTAPYPAPIFNAPGNLPGAAHTKELSYLFHQSELTSAQRKISEVMIGYWTNFAAKGDPNGSGLPTWPAYTGEGQMVMKFESASVGADANLHARAKCRFWAEQGFGNLFGPYPTPTQAGADYK